MHGISNIPLVRAFMPFLAGIIVATSFNISITTNTFLLISLFAFSFLFFFKQFNKTNYNKRWVFGITISFFFFLTGNVLTVNHNLLQKPNHFSQYGNKEGYVILTIIEPTSERQNSYRIVGRVKKTINDTLSKKTDGKIMLYVEKDSIASTLKYGDQIITKNSFDEIPPPQNPHQFNYKSHLAFNNIFHQTYRASGHYMVIASGKGNFLKSTALDYRQKALSTIKKYDIIEDEFAVISALLLGYREYIDDKLRQKFAGAGAMHILCVSGLHVGIIYVILNGLFSFLNKIKYGNKFKFTIILLIIWFYAAITGFSPSVLRASTMFSFVALAKSFNRYTNIYNILAASAFVLTIIDPYIVTKIGFQLSYLAVISIVSLQPYLYNIFHVKNFILSKVWAITTVSIAAQAATGPLVIYYFNQFPNYFILTNLAVIPLTSIIIYTALIFLLVSPISLIADFISKVLSFFVYALNKSVHFVESLPYSNMQNQNLGLTETLLIFILITLISAFFINKSKLYFKISLPVILLLCVSFSVKKITTQQQNSFVVYSINNHTAIDFISGKNYIFVADNDLLTKGKKDIDYNITQNRTKKNVKISKNILINNDTTVIYKPNFWQKNNYFMFNGLKIKILTEFDKSNAIDNVTPLSLDYLIITQNPWLKIEEVQQLYNFKTLIIDSSNPFWKVNNWKEECKKSGINYWSTRHNGSYIRHL